jgi:hypothetical protein
MEALCITFWYLRYWNTIITDKGHQLCFGEKNRPRRLGIAQSLVLGIGAHCRTDLCHYFWRETVSIASVGISIFHWVYLSFGACTGAAETLLCTDRVLAPGVDALGTMPRGTDATASDEREQEEQARATRPRRRAAARYGSQKRSVAVDPAYYLGYADDDETPEMIMRKFEALERLQAQKAANTQQSSGDANDSQTAKEEVTLTAAEQAELFRQTSFFSVDMLAGSTTQSLPGGVGESTDLIAVGALDDSSFERVLAEYGLDAVLFGAELSDSEPGSEYDDGEDLLWEEALESDRSARFPGRLTRSRPDRSESSRVALELWRARAALLMRLSAGGDALAAAQAAAMIPAALRARRRRLAAEGVLRETIPTEYPLPVSWARTIRPLREAVQEGQQLERNYECGRLLRFANVFQAAKTLHERIKGRHFRCVVLDPPCWNQPDFRVEQLRSLRIAEIVPFGFVFIWVPKTRIAETLRWFGEEMHQGGGGGFHFVESFCVVLKWTNNRVATLLSEPSDLLCLDQPVAVAEHAPSGVYACSHETCLVLRRPGPHIELAHQRNPDLCFDYVRLHQKRYQRRRPELFYHMIETMLPEVARDGDMLCVWADQSVCKRTCWVSVVEDQSLEAGESSS